MAKQLPHKLYVRRFQDSDVDYFTVSEDYEDLADLDEIVEIGIYTRYETKQLDGRPKFLK